MEISNGNMDERGVFEGKIQWDEDREDYRLVQGFRSAVVEEGQPALYEEKDVEVEGVLGRRKEDGGYRIDEQGNLDYVIEGAEIREIK